MGLQPLNALLEGGVLLQRLSPTPGKARSYLVRYRPADLPERDTILGMTVMLQPTEHVPADDPRSIALFARLSAWRQRG
jgi:hypothetical protein